MRYFEKLKRNARPSLCEYSRAQKRALVISKKVEISFGIKKVSLHGCTAKHYGEKLFRFFFIL